jgi:hypothetical protein
MGKAIVNEDAASARRYRQRAREVRAIAAEVQDATVRFALLRIARDYDRLALMRLRMGKLARSNKGSNPTRINFIASSSLMPGFFGY